MDKMILRGGRTRNKLQGRKNGRKERVETLKSETLKLSSYWCLRTFTGAPAPGSARAPSILLRWPPTRLRDSSISLPTRLNASIHDTSQLDRVRGVPGPSFSYNSRSERHATAVSFATAAHQLSRLSNRLPTSRVPPAHESLMHAGPASFETFTKCSLPVRLHRAAGTPQTDLAWDGLLLGRG